MDIYLYMLLFWSIVYIVVRELKVKYKNFNARKTLTIIFASSIFLLLALRHPSVGVDTYQYLYRYNNVIYNLDTTLFSNAEWLFYGFASLLKKIGLNDQMYLIFNALIISLILSRFFYKYSTNIFISFYLYVTIGLFTMSFSGIKQMLAISVILIAFEYMLKNKFFAFTITVVLASFIHQSALVFLPAYFFRKVKINFITGIILIVLISSSITWGSLLTNYFEAIMPEKYLIYTLDSTNIVNPLIIVISIAIPTASLILNNIESKNINQHNEIFSVLFILSLFNTFFTILSLNSHMVSRLSYYFLPFIMLLIPHVIMNVKNKNIKMITLILCVILPLVQFTLSTPNGTLQIDDYKFFWMVK